MAYALTWHKSKNFSPSGSAIQSSDEDVTMYLTEEEFLRVIAEDQDIPIEAYKKSLKLELQKKKTFEPPSGIQVKPIPN